MCIRCFEAEQERRYRASLPLLDRWLRRLISVLKFIVGAWIGVIGFCCLVAFNLLMLTIIFGPFLVLFRWMAH